ncbi:DinB family protein [Sinomicrobium sp. M5D2P9]
MITRIWHGKTKTEDADNYLQFLLEKGTSEYLQTRGNISVKVWRRQEGEQSHFYTVTEWTGIEAVKSFAGDDVSRAKYYPEDEGVLLEFEEEVIHCETYKVSNNRVRGFIKQLNEFFHGENWHSESLEEKLRDVDNTLAFQQPVPEVHSIAEIIWHCIYWRQVFIRYAEGDPDYRDNTVEKLNFLPLKELKRKGWDVLRRELEQTQEEILELLESKTDDFLDGRPKPGGDTLGYILEGILQHDIYHTGQIGLVKKIISVTR